MKLNKQNNIYTIIYIVVLVVIVGAALAYTSMSLKDKQTANADADKMKQILMAAHIPSDDNNVAEIYNEHIFSTPVVNIEGNIIGDNGFDIDVHKQIKIKNTADRKLPVFECHLDNGETKYILPVYGSGLWGPIWGYVAVDSNGSTIYGAYFAHQGETPGLGAKIEEPDFRNQFDGKNLFKDGNFLPIAVVKKGQHAPNGEDYVDAVSGGTITSKGVSAMLDDCLKPYEAFLNKIRNKSAE